MFLNRAGENELYYDSDHAKKEGPEHELKGEAFPIHAGSVPRSVYAVKVPNRVTPMSHIETNCDGF